ncbi:MAG: protein kinase [Chloroflexales bacterium]|nr:protein kinase [Chloroflexales bacterium]
MRQDCLLCERTSPNNLYCQEVYCPAEMSPPILNHGDWLGNIEIVKPIIVLRSAVLYEARYQQKKVLLKVAHPGPENRERLKREAEFLKQIRHEKEQPIHLPILMPPYANTTIERNAYGKVVLQGHLLYYCLFEHFAGEPLRDILAKNVQMWVYHIGWIVTNLAAAVAFLQSKGMYHFGLSPDCILVYLDDKSDVPRIQLFDFGIASDRDHFPSNWYRFFVHPAYTAPELIEPRTPRPSYATDVYGLGLVLYELLVGEPAFPYKVYSDDEVYDAVRRGRRIEMTRGEDVGKAADIAVKAIDLDGAKRYQTAAELTKALQEAFGEAPEKKRLLNARTIWFIVGAVFAVVLLIVFAIVSSGAAG